MTTTESSTVGSRAAALQTAADGSVARMPERRLGVRATPLVILTAAVAVSAVVRGAIGLWMPAPWILPDEIVYSELAKSIAAGDRPSIRGIPVFGWGEVYPTLIAPAWLVFEDPLRAYHATLAVNAVVMSLAVVPAYLLARMFVSQRLSIVVALFTVLIPSMSYTDVIMSENAFYPAFLLSLWLIARAVRRPTLASQALALAGLGLIAFTRIQGIALVGAYVAAVAVYALTGPRDERNPYVRKFLPSAAVGLAASFSPAALSIVTGNGAFGWLGARSETFEGFHAWEIPGWFVFLTGDLVLYVAVAPAAASAVMLLRAFADHPTVEERLFAAVALPTFAAMLGSVSLVSAALDVDGTENLNERYVFYVVPLMFVGLALWLSAGLPRPRMSTWLVIAGCSVVAAVVPVDRLEHNAAFQSVALLPWILLEVSGFASVIVLGGFAVGCALLWRSCRPDRAGRLWLLTGVTMVFIGLLAVGDHNFSSTSSARAFHGDAPQWIDDSVPADATVDVVWDQRAARRGLPDPFASLMMVAEFFNDSVGDVYRIGEPTFFETFLPTLPVTVSPSLTVLRDGRPLVARFVLTTCKTPIPGQRIAEAPNAWLQLLEVDGIVRLDGPSRCKPGLQ